MVRSGFPLASNTSRDGRSNVVIVTSYDVPPLTIAKREPAPIGSSLRSSALLHPAVPLRLVAEVGQDVEDALRRTGDLGRRGRTHCAILTRRGGLNYTTSRPGSPRVYALNSFQCPSVTISMPSSVTLIAV